MTIEEACDKLINSFNESATRTAIRFHENIEYWGWLGKPAVGSFPDTLFIISINNKIKEWDDAECLTSKSNYIRGCKKYYLKNK